MPTRKKLKIALKGSKSISNRALLLCEINKILGLKIPKLKNLSTSDDTKVMKEGLRLLTKEKTPKIINLGNAGTGVRFLTAFAAATGKEVTITGSKRMKKRPIEDLVKALNKLGCNVESTNGHLPVIIHKSEFIGGKTEISTNESSQFLSALLMIAPLAKTQLEIAITGKKVSEPYIDMTFEMMKVFQEEPKEFFIEGDASSASYLGAYALLKDVELQIENLSEKSLQGDIRFLEYLKKMEQKKSKTKPKISPASHKQHASHEQLSLSPLGIVDMNQTPDLVPTFAILATTAKGSTHITNIANLKLKESDRIIALAKGLKKLGIEIKVGEDFLEIEGQGIATLIEKKAKKHITINSQNDHRIAMAFGVLKKTILPNLKITNPSVVSKSYPEFWSDLNHLNKMAIQTKKSHK